MKYNFDEVIDRTHEAGSYSSKWSEAQSMANMFGGSVPEDRLCFFLADMDFRCAPEITEALQEVTRHGIYGYSRVPDAYFQAICRWMKDRFDLEVKPEQIITTRGAHTAIVNAIEKLTKPGDGVIVPQPTYYYNHDVTGIGRHYVGFQMKNDNGYYTFDWETFEKLCKIPQNTMAIFQQPHNPTGRTWTKEEVERMADICRKNNVIMICDDVHMDLHRKNVKVVPFINYVGPEGIVMITGVNKTFNTAGLAITNTIVQDEKLREKLGPAGFGMSPFSIAACIAAYTKGDDWLDALNDYIDDVMDYAVERFHKEMPRLKVWKPEGTYILWLDFTGYGLTSDELDEKLAKTAHIGMSNGAGMEAPEGTVFRRMCITSPKSVIKEAIDRMVKVMEG